MLKSKNMIVINSNNLQLLGEYKLYTSKMNNETYEVVTYVKLIDNKGVVVHETGNNLHMRIENIKLIENEIVVALENNFMNMIDDLCYKCNFNYFALNIKQYVNRIEAEKKSIYLNEINEQNKKLKKELFELAELKNIIVVDMLDSIEIYEKLDDRVNQGFINRRTYSDSKKELKELCNELVKNEYIKLINKIKNDDTIYNTYNEIENNNYKDVIELLS
ncbi:hypothetical protein [Terrisporobacter sp.]|uniref:hypothetical protein n=1 Tax=Terrisporobacter sp. TaxID=1965305 RepID=UPI00262EC3AB|nr:hypothetical protein [Terrisporobacter sp.]